MTIDELKEEMRQDILTEEEARRNLDFAVDLVDKDDHVGECIEYIQTLCTKLRLYDWEMTPSELVRRLEAWV